MIATSDYFDIIINDCLDIFRKKMHDYGSAWRILRLKSLTDQIFIKAQRIRSIDDKGVQKIKEGIDAEFMGILNYSIILKSFSYLSVMDSPKPGLLSSRSIKPFLGAGSPSKI